MAFNIIYLIASLVGILARYIFIRSFYDVKNKISKVEVLLYASYYIFGNALYLILEVPAIIITANIVLLIVICLSYERKIRKALVVTALIYVVNAALEVGVFLLTNSDIVELNPMDKVHYTSIFGVILINVLSYLIARLYSSIARPKKTGKVLRTYWFALSFIPFASFYLLMTLLQSTHLDDTQLLVSSVIIILVNVLQLELYNRLVSYYELKVKESTLKQINADYSNQLGMMKAYTKNISKIQHDFNRHLGTIRSLTNKNQHESVSDYINDLIEEVGSYNHGFNTGNIVVDSILNYELQSLPKDEVDLTLDISDIPIELEIKDYELTVILSNIIRNAVEAIENVDKKSIHIQIDYDRGILFVRVVNSFDGIVVGNSKSLRTRKKQGEIHGLGLGNVKEIVERYDGDIRPVFDESVFEVEMIIYC